MKKIAADRKFASGSNAPSAISIEHRRWTEGDRKVEPTDRFRPPHWRSIGYEAALRLQRGRLLCRGGPRLASPPRQANSGLRQAIWPGKSRLGVVMGPCCTAVSSQSSSQKALDRLGDAQESHKSRLVATNLAISVGIVGHEENRGRQEVRPQVQRPLGHVDANTEGGRKVIGRWNPPTDFDHLIGDLLDMSTSRQLHAWIWTTDPCSTLSVNREGVRKAHGRRSEVVWCRRAAVPSSSDLPAELSKPVETGLQGIRKSFGSRSGGTEDVAKPLVFDGGSKHTRGQSK